MKAGKEKNATTKHVGIVNGVVECSQYTKIGANKPWRYCESLKTLTCSEIFVLRVQVVRRSKKIAKLHCLSRKGSSNGEGVDLNCSSCVIRFVIIPTDQKPSCVVVGRVEIGGRPGPVDGSAAHPTVHPGPLHLQ